MTNLTHKNCTDNRCQRCFREHIELGHELDTRTGCDTVDHLGKFHLWLSEKGIKPETEHGWGTAAYFDEKNILAYVSGWNND